MINALFATETKAGKRLSLSEMNSFVSLSISKITIFLLKNTIFLKYLACMHFLTSPSHINLKKLTLVRLLISVNGVLLSYRKKVM